MKPHTRLELSWQTSCWREKYSYVIATHVEKDHVHNHIIFCATDNIDHKKYNTCKRNYYKIRKLSDELCSEHHLSVIVPGQQRGKSYEEWEANQNGKSWKDKVRRDIDATIKLSNSYDDFLRLIQLKGYEIKGEQPDDSLKYIAFRPAGKDRFVRGSAKSLGSAYTREMIRERLETRDQKRNAYKQREYSTRKLINTRQQQFEESPGLKHWADIENLKIAASTYANAGSITELKAKVTEQQELSEAARSELVELEREMKSASEILKYAQQYVSNKPYHTRSKKSNNPDAYFRSHESQLLLYDGAKNMLRSAGIDLKSINLEQMLSDYRVLEEKHKELQKTYRTANVQLQKMEQSLQKITQYFEKEGAVTEKDVNQRNNRTL